jgi:hypothetical protein
MTRAKQKIRMFGFGVGTEEWQFAGQAGKHGMAFISFSF